MKRCYCYQRGTKDAPKHPEMHRTAQQQEVSDSNVDGTDIENHGLDRSDNIK